MLPSLIDSDRICRGVSIGGFDVGDMTVPEARGSLQEHVRQLQTEPIILGLGTEQWRVNPADVGTAIELESALGAARMVGHTGSLVRRLSERSAARKSGVDIPWIVSVDEQALRDLVFDMARVVSIDPKDATLIITAEDEVIIEPSMDGRKLDVKRLIYDLRSATLLGTARYVAMPVDVVTANVTTAELEAKGIRRLISKYSTKFNAANYKRTQNIRLGVQKLDGLVLAPGAELSFNDVVGPRVPERGFMEADIIFNSELVPGIGGGICQVSSTLYNAALLALMEVASRVNHSLPSSYVPLGRDATVSYGSIDLKVRNTTKHHVLIRCFVSGNTVTFKIFGDIPDDMDVSIRTEVLERIEPNTIEQMDPTIPTGARVVVEKGSPGYRVAVERVVKVDGAVVSTELISRDRYKPQSAVVRVGTGAPALDLPPVQTQ